MVELSPEELEALLASEAAEREAQRQLREGMDAAYEADRSVLDFILNG
jgi:hypothetical protein